LKVNTPVNPAPQSKSPSSRSGAKHCHELYEKAQQNLKLKKQLMEKKAKQEENSYLQFSFQPNSNNTRARSRSKSADRMALPDRLCQWDRIRNIKMEKEKEKKMVQEKKECTFKPNIEESNVCDDENFIKRNMGQINSYIERQQRIQDKKKEDEKLYKKKFGYGENYTIKKTVPKEFNLSSHHRQVSTENIITKNHQNYLQEFNRIRSKLGTEDFFEKGNAIHTSEQNENFFFDVEEGEKDVSTYDQDQLAMAVKYLHKQLHND